MNQEEFENLLVSMGSPDGSVQKPAEEHYYNFRDNNPTLTMQCLLEVAANGQTEGATMMALVMLRKLFAKQCDYYERSSDDEQADIRERLLNVFANAKSNNHRKNSAACVSALAVKMNDTQNGWDDLWRTLFDTILDTDAPSEHRASACDVIHATATVLATTYLAGHHKELANGLTSCVGDKHIEVKKSAFDAVHAVASVVDDKKLDPFKPLIGAMLEGLENVLNEGDWDGATRLCSSIAGIVENSPKLVNKHTTNLLEAMMHVASSPEVEMDARHMAVEVMVSYAESEPKAIKKVQGFTKSLIELLFEYMLHKEYDDDWDVTYDAEGASDAEGITDFDIGSTCIDRVATAIPGKTMQSVCADLVLGNINNESASHRVAALNVLTYCTEGLNKAFVTQLADIVQAVLPCCEDGDRYVRYAALQCFAQFASDFGPLFQLDHHQAVLTVAKNALQEETPRMQATACSVIDNFFDECEAGEDDERANSKMYQDYYQALAVDLVGLHENTGLIFVKRACLGALSAMIQVAKEEMSAYVKDLVPVFQRDLNMDESNSDIRDLKCKAVECTTILASSVGYGPFEEYATDVCEFLNAQLSQDLPTDDPRMKYYLRGWTCMVDCMKERALPYLDVVMPPLLNVANMDADLEVMDREIGEEEQADDDDVEYVKICRPGKGEETVRIRTSAIEEKQTAVTILMSIVEALKDKLQNFLEPVTHTMVDTLTFSALAEIRETSAQTLAMLAESYANGDQSQIPGLVNHVVPELIQAARMETEVSVCGEMIIALYKTIRAAPPNTLEDRHLQEICQVLHIIYANSIQRRAKFIDERANLGAEEEDAEDVDEELEDQEEEETFLLHECTDALGILLKFCPSFVEPFQGLFLDEIQNLIADRMHNLDKRMGLSLLCEFGEQAPMAALDHLETITQAFLHFASIPEPDVCQPSLYGLNVCLQILINNVPQPDDNTMAFAKEVYSILISFLRTDEVRKDEWEESACNAMSTALFLIENFGDAEFFDSGDLFQALVSHLPGKGDVIEAERLHGRLVYWIQNGHPLVENREVRNSILSILRREPNLKKGEEPVHMDDETKDALSKL